MFGLAVTAILVTVAVCIAIGSLVKGIEAFFEDGGGVWLLVIGGISVVAYLLHRLTKSRD